MAIVNQPSTGEGAWKRGYESCSQCFANGTAWNAKELDRIAGSITWIGIAITATVNIAIPRYFQLFTSIKHAFDGETFVGQDRMRDHKAHLSETLGAFLPHRCKLNRPRNYKRDTGIPTRQIGFRSEF